MSGERKISASKRRTRTEVQQLVAEFVSSGMRRSEFCRSRGLSFGTPDRHLKKRRGKRESTKASAAGQLMTVELSTKKSPPQNELSWLAVLLSSGRRIEVQRGFDMHRFEPLVGVLERA